ncbi:aquaporin-11 [Paramormyrops kingsleyae]|uniref:Aquaporin n=1 Tax=Paramormyrops kingsleyae TaxID=1676925 RepID=A0A3B3QS83_9TELE|nr:aquaporin-11 [Paramormyrops kingsleyae]
MADLCASLALLTAVVLLSEASRRAAAKLLAHRAAYAVEVISTFQLCACTQELKLLGELGRTEPRIMLTLTYLISVVHALTFSGAICNPSGALESVYRRSLSGSGALRRIACQFLAAAVARSAAPYLWALGLYDLHARHRSLRFQCQSPIDGTLPTAAAVELGCAFAVQSALTCFKETDVKYRVHIVAAVITTLVYAGGRFTGAVFNPALAFSTQFACEGHTFMEYSIVYWLGPILGMTFSVLLSDKVIPLLSGRTFQKDMEFPLAATKKLQ